MCSCGIGTRSFHEIGSRPTAYAMRSTLHRTQVRFGLILFVIGVANFAFALQNYLVGHRDLAWSLVGMISGAGMAVFGGSFIIGTKRPRTANSEHRTTDQAMSKPKHVGIPIGGGVLTFEPSVSTATFWIVEAVHWFVSFGKVFGGRTWVPMYIAIWNADRTAEFYREGPYRNGQRRRRTTEITKEIRKDGLETFLFKQRISR